jgi:hypothetical protein
MPWTLNVSYSFDYNKQSSKPISQTLSMNGNVTFTKNMTATVRSGYDFDRKQITNTQVGIQRDLHCWTMDVSWHPIGPMRMWSFTIRAKAALLRDLKYERQKSPFDSYY